MNSQSVHRDPWARVRSAFLFRSAWSVRFSAFFIFLVVGSALFAPLITTHVLRFEPNEVHSLVGDSPPGSRDVPSLYPEFDGNQDVFGAIDSDGSGFIECDVNENGSSQYMASRVDCRELTALSERFRFFRFLFMERDGSTGLNPDGVLQWAEYPETDADIEDQFRGLGLSGKQEFQRLDRNDDEVVTELEMLEMTRVYRLNWPMLSPYDVNEDFKISRDEFPGVPMLQTFLLGTDGMGRDVLSRVIWGGRISIAVGLLATLISLLIGTVIGAFSGYVGGRTDRFVMSVVDLLYGLPFLLLVIMLLVWFGRSTVNLFIALGAVQWLTICRIVRGQVRTVRQEEYVLAAESLGAHPSRVVIHHVLRNSLGPILAYTSLMIPAVIQEEAFLSYLGLGVQAPDASWGTLIAEGVGKLGSSWWITVSTGIVFGVTIFSFYILGERMTRMAGDLRESNER